jgi:hypothetical protein
VKMAVVVSPPPEPSVATAASPAQRHPHPHESRHTSQNSQSDHLAFPSSKPSSASQDQE